MEDLATSGFELRFDLAGRAAVRVAGGPVAPRHVEPVPPPAPWVIEARCGDAAGWLLAHAAPADPEAARMRLERAVEREAAARLQAAARQLAPLAADLLERLTHRLRTDVTTLQAVADGAVKGLFEPADLELLPGELERSGREAQRRLTAAREVMGVLTPGARSAPEPIEATLRTELAAAGREADDHADPPARFRGRSIPGPGWARARASWPATRGSECSSSDLTGAGGPCTRGRWDARGVDRAHDRRARACGPYRRCGGRIRGRDGAVRHPPDAARCTAIWLIGSAERSVQLD